MIELRHGDIYADGLIQQKSLAQQRAMAVVVYDSNHEPSRLPSRWLPDAAESNWRQSGSRFWRTATNRRPGEQAMDWLTYHHRRQMSNGIADECPITDDCGYNQTAPVTESNAVRDLAVRCRMRVADLPCVTWLMTDGLSQFLIELDFLGAEVSVVQDGRRMATTPLPRPPSDVVLCELALCDQQVLLALDRREVLGLPYTPPDVPLRPTSRPGCRRQPRRWAGTLGSGAAARRVLSFGSGTQSAAEPRSAGRRRILCAGRQQPGLTRQPIMGAARHCRR